jgi:hypothetical protein
VEFFGIGLWKLERIWTPEMRNKYVKFAGYLDPTLDGIVTGFADVRKSANSQQYFGRTQELFTDKRSLFNGKRLLFNGK